MRVISNTQVSTKNLCDRQHYYRFVDNIEPRRFSLNSPIGLGILGHEAFETYYLIQLNGGSVDDSSAEAQSFLQREYDRLVEEAVVDFNQLQKVIKLIGLFQMYKEYYRVEPFKVLAVEKEFQVPIGPDLKYGMKLDLLVEWTRGIERGSIVIIDHKFVYNFKSEPVLEMDCQLPKYTKTLRENGYNVSHSVFNQVRYRDLKNPTPDKLFHRQRMDSSKLEIETIWDEQLITANKIYSDIEQDTPPIRTMHLLTCRGCFFQQLCKAELRGNDTSNMRVSEYKPSKYGYVDLIDTGATFE